MDRTVIAKLEKGTRQTITVGEVIVLARALRVPPVDLLFDLGGQEAIEVLPGVSTDSWDALKWFTGEADRLPADSEASQDAKTVQWYRQHDQLLADWWTRRKDLEISLGTEGRVWLDDFQAGTAPSEDITRRMIELKADALRGAGNAISLLRQQMLSAGLTPPSLGAAAQYIEPDQTKGETT